MLQQSELNSWFTESKYATKAIRYATKAIQDIHNRFTSHREAYLTEIAPFIPISSMISEIKILALREIDQVNWPEDLREAARAYGLTKLEFETSKMQEIVRSILNEAGISSSISSNVRAAYNFNENIFFLLNEVLWKRYILQIRQVPSAIQIREKDQKDYITAVINSFCKCPTAADIDLLSKCSTHEEWKIRCRSLKKLV